jgi:hypothetical protein
MITISHIFCGGIFSMANCLILPRKKAVFLLANLSIRSTSLQELVFGNNKRRS